MNLLSSYSFWLFWRHLTNIVNIFLSIVKQRQNLLHALFIFFLFKEYTCVGTVWWLIIGSLTLTSRSWWCVTMATLHPFGDGCHEENFAIGRPVAIATEERQVVLSRRGTAAKFPSVQFENDLRRATARKFMSLQDLVLWGEAVNRVQVIYSCILWPGAENLWDR